MLGAKKKANIVIADITTPLVSAAVATVDCWLACMTTAAARAK
jgi:hypothetical protein